MLIGKNNNEAKLIGQHVQETRKISLVEVQRKRMRELQRVMMLLLNWMQHWKIYTWEVWREKNVIKPAPGKRSCNCRNEVYHKQIGPGMFQQMTEQVCEQCQNVKYEREGYFVTVDIEKGVQDGQVQAVVGFEKTIKHLDGHLVDISTKELYGVSPLTSSAESKDAFAVILSCFACSRA
ncbi:hypothetical protein WN943_007325 [Citrus x changshan-huyou]